MIRIFEFRHQKVESDRSTIPHKIWNPNPSRAPCFTVPHARVPGPEAPGYSLVFVRPRMVDVEWAQGAVPTPHGDQASVGAEWVGVA